MRTTLFALSAILGLAAASPVPQDIDFAAVDALPTDLPQGAETATALSQVPTYNPSTAAATAAVEATSSPLVAKRDLLPRTACAPQATGYGPVPSPDTASAFLADTDIAAAATGAATPQGYSLAFSNLQGSTQQNGYLGYYTFTSYDTVKCQQKCDAATNCWAFNIYYERDPTVDPGVGCDNPASTSMIKCVLYGTPVCDDTATNKGQWRDSFQVAIAGSNGYNKVAAPPSYTNFTGPAELPGAINAPLKNGVNTFIGSRTFAGPYDPSQCAAVCQSTTEYDRATAGASGTYMACNMFVSYVISKDNVPQGTQCAFYTYPWARSYATNVGQYSGSDYYSVSQAYAYTLTAQDSGVVSS